jgi:hypothetical protein
MQTYLKNVQDAIITIENIDYSIDGAFDMVVNAIKGIGKIPRFHFKFEANQVFFRSRPNDEEEYYKEIKKISYPPKDKVKKYARSNKPDQSVFYCSDTRRTCYVELATDMAENTNIGETIGITISTWQLALESEVVLIINPNDKNQTEYSKIHGDSVNFLLNTLDDDMKEGTKVLYEYLANKFATDAQKDPSIYIITSAFANTILEDGIDGIMYPSVPYQGNGFNIAFQTNLIDDSKIRLINVNRDTFIIEQTEEGKHKFRTIAEMEQGIINWNDKSISWIVK